MLEFVDFQDPSLPPTEDDRVLEDVLKDLEAALRAKEDAIMLRDAAYKELSAVADEAQNNFKEADTLKKLLARAQKDGANASTIAHVTELAKEVSELEIKLSIAYQEKDAILAKTAADAAIYEAKLMCLEKQLAYETLQNKQLRTKVAELKGNVRVFARVRPFIKIDGLSLNAQTSPCVITLSDGESVKVIKNNKADKNEEYIFRFDRCFGPTSTQECVFEEVSEFVQSAMDGFNVCILSYGQTGSGKTFTMNGGVNNERGLIPRAMEALGNYRNKQAQFGWTYSLKATYVEIYNESIRDLLRDNAAVYGEHEIKKDVNDSIYVTDVNVIEFDPSDLKQVEDLLTKASRFRSSTSTNMNEESSRSHAVFTLRVGAVNDKEDLHLSGALSLVDLAGSERLDRSGVSGDTVKETIAINKSLSSLADVFLAIRKKNSHIPYRNSKLTTLLQQALGGEGRTLMLLALSPTQSSAFESLSSCRFGSQVSKCELGKPRKMINDLTLLRSVEAERISHLDQQLELAKCAKHVGASISPLEAAPSTQKPKSKIKL